MKQLKTLVAVLLFLAGLTSSVMAQTGTSAQYMQAGNTAYGAKNYDQAIQYYQAVVGLTPNYGPAYQGLGNCYYSKGDNTNALANYEKALNLDPNNASLSSFVQSLKAKVGTAPADPAATSPAASTALASYASSANKFELAPFAGLGYSLETGYGIGFGGGLAGFFPVGGGLSFGGSAAYYTFSGPSSSFAGATISESYSNIEVLAALKYRLGTGSMKPYLIGAAGLSLFSLTETGSVSGVGSASASASTTNPMIQAGAGLEFEAGSGMNIFVEGKASVIIGSGGTSTYLPVNVGLSFNL